MIPVTTENGTTLVLSDRLLRRMTSFTCKNLQTEQDTLLGLLKLQNSILAEIVMNSTAVIELPNEASDLIWSSVSGESRVELCKDEHFVQRLTGAQGKEILESDDEAMILALIESLPFNIDDFERLDEIEARGFVMSLVRHSSSTIKNAIMHKPILESMVDDVLSLRLPYCLDDGILLPTQLRLLEPGNVPYVTEFGNEILHWVIENAHRIENPRTQYKLAHKILSKKGGKPYAMAMAQNKGLCDRALTRLSKSKRPSIANAANRTLAQKHKARVHN